MRNKEKLHEWIDRYNTGRLSGEELGQFIDIMNRDPRVREEVLLDKELNIVLGQTDILELRNKINKVRTENSSGKNRNYRILLMAASLVLLLSIGSFLFYVSRSNDAKIKHGLGDAQNRTGKPMLNKPATGTGGVSGYSFFHVNKPGLLACDTNQMVNAYDLLACYQPNKALENLVGTISRSGSFMLISPAPLSVFTRKSVIWFSWKTDSPEETSLQIENNLGSIVYESDSNYKQAVSINASFLEKGLFYFKIINKDEVIYFGKFTVQ